MRSSVAFSACAVVILAIGVVTTAAAGPEQHAPSTVIAASAGGPPCDADGYSVDWRTTYVASLGAYGVDAVVLGNVLPHCTTGTITVRLFDIAGLEIAKATHPPLPKPGTSTEAVAFSPAVPAQDIYGISVDTTAGQPQPTAHPTPKATATPRVTPRPTPSPRPTATPRASAGSSATPPVPTASPTPRASAAVTPTPAATQAPTRSPDEGAIAPAASEQPQNRAQNPLRGLVEDVGTLLRGPLGLLAVLVAASSFWWFLLGRRRRRREEREID